MPEAKGMKITKIRYVHSQFCSRLPHLKSLFRLSDILNSLGISIQNPEESLKIIP